MSRRIDASLTIEGTGDFAPRRVQLLEGTSRVTRCLVELALSEETPLGAAISRRAIVTLSEDEQELRRWELVVVRAAFIDIERGAHRYELELHAPLTVLSHCRSIRKFRDTDARRVVAAVLAEANIDFDFRLREQPQTRPYCVQYRETHLAFLSRLLEHDGIHWVCEDGGGLTLTDSSPSSPSIGEGGYFELVESRGALVDARPALHEIEVVSSAVPARAAVSDFDWKKPDLPLLAATGADGSVQEVYDFPAGYRTPAEGERLCRLRLEALVAEARVLAGESSVTAFAAGRHFSFGGRAAATAELEGSWFLVEVHHDFSRLAQGASFMNRFRATPSAVPWRPPMKTPRPHVAGIHTAFVRGPAGAEIHTDVHGRFKAQFHWDRDAKRTDEDSRWIRMLQENSTSLFLARTGWEVQVAYLDGDPDRPIGLGRLINGAMPPIYPQPDRKTVMTVRTPSSLATGGYNELVLDDYAGAMHFDLRAERDLENIVGHDRTELVGHCETHYVGANFARDVGANQSVFIGANSRLTSGATHAITVNGSREKSVGGGERITIKDFSDGTVAGSDAEKVAASRVTRSGAERAGAIVRTVAGGFARSVGGSHVVCSGGNMEVQAGHGLTEFVGGSRCAIARGGDVTLSAGGPLSIDVRQSCLAIVKSHVGSEARNAQTEINEDARFTSATRVYVGADEIRVKGESALRLTQGELTIELQPDKIALKGKVKLKVPKGQIIVRGKPANFTRY